MVFYWQGLSEVSIILLAVSVLLSFRYFQKLQNEDFYLKLILTTLRLFSFLCVVLLIANPYIKWSNKKDIKPNINLIIDNSISMSNFNQEVNRIISKFDTLSIENDFKLKIQTNTSKSINFKFHPNENNTDFTKLNEIINKNDINILVSDGNINSGLDYESIINLIDSPINIIGIGHKKQINDLALINIEFPDFHIESKELKLKFSIYSNLDTSITTACILKNETGIIHKEIISIPEGKSNQDLIFNIKGNKLRNENFLEIISSIEEQNKVNNSSKINIKLLSKNRIVGFISGGMSQNTSLIKKIIEDQPRVEINHSIRIGNRWGNKWSNEIMASFELIVIEGFPINQNDKKNFTELFNLKTPILYFSGPYENKLTTEIFINKFNFTVTKVLENSSNQFLASPTFYNANEYPEQLLKHNWLHNQSIFEFSNNSSAITAIENNLFIFIPDFMKLSLKLNGNEIDNLIHKTISNYIYKALNEDSNLISIISKYDKINIGETNAIEININKEGNESIIESGLKINHNNENKIEIFNNPKFNNKYEFLSNYEGNTDIIGYFISNNSDTVWSKSISFPVLKLQKELNDKFINEIGMKLLAENSGGIYYPYNNHSKLLNNLRNLKKHSKIISQSASPIDFQKFWILIAIFLLVEWMLRKRNGLL